MSKRIRCLFHKERTASLVVYTRRYKCFGCGAHGYTKDLPERYKVSELEEDYEQEDIVEKFAYIKSLKIVEHRGIRLPADERGYFIIWPDSTYYKYRLFHPGKGSKYIGPRGHKPPLYWAKRSDRYSTLYLVEGEINALSLSLVVSGSVCSLGSATNFNAISLSKYLTVFKEYSNIVVIADQDAAGTKALIETQAYLLYKVPFVTCIQMIQDCNDILCERGQEALAKEVQQKVQKGM